MTNDQLSFITISDMTIHALSSLLPIYQYFPSSILQLSLFNIFLQIISLPCANAKTDISIIIGANNSGNADSVIPDSLQLPDLPVDIYGKHEPIKNIIGGKLIFSFSLPLDFF